MTTAADLLRRELGEKVVVVPEAATILFSGGFPRYDEPNARRAAQSAIFHVQRNVEDVQSARYPGVSTDTSRDHDVTDWSALARFTEEFADEVREASKGA